jgi:hypothetical protein
MRSPENNKEISNNFQGEHEKEALFVVNAFGKKHIISLNQNQ